VARRADAVLAALLALRLTEGIEPDLAGGLDLSVPRILFISFGGKRERPKCICAPKEVDACANLDRPAESVDDEGRKHGSDVLAYDNVGSFIQLGRFAIDNSPASFGKRPPQAAIRRPVAIGVAARELSIARACKCGV
jgi:hypothetical protein